MDDRRLGRLLRAVRQRLDLRQSDLAVKASVSQKTVSEIELGRIEAVGLCKVRRVAMALDVSVSLDAWWRGGQGDRLLDRAHAAIVDATIRILRDAEWEIVPEFSFNHFGDRGSVDILAWHPGERILLIIEVKATLTDLQDLLASLSRKVRVVPRIVLDQRGWDARHLARIVLVADTTANRSVLRRHAATFDAAFPARSREARSWVKRPVGPLAALWFLSTSGAGTVKSVARARVRRKVGARA
jgi:transcriptional regulator with XRE-family HTH domain